MKLRPRKPGAGVPAEWSGVADLMKEMVMLMDERWKLERQVTAAEKTVEQGNERLKLLDKQVIAKHAQVNRALHSSYYRNVNLS